MGLLSLDIKSIRMLLCGCFIVTILFYLRFFPRLKIDSCSLDFGHTSSGRNVSKLPSPFPRKIWQSSKVGPGGLEEDDRKAVQSWVKMNQKHRYEILTMDNAESYVRTTYPHRYDIEETFMDLHDPILRADFICYLVLFGDGGVFSDLDTVSLKPIEDWIPLGFRNRANLVVGIEYDRLEGGRWVDWTLDLQICTWALLAKPGHPIMELTIDQLMARVRKLALKQGTTISGIKASRKEVLDTTGPALFSQMVFEGLSHATGTNFTHLNVTGLTAPRLVGDVLFLPINAFGSGQSHSNSGSPEEDSALVKHLFKGSWKDDHKFEKSTKPRRETQEMNADAALAV